MVKLISLEKFPKFSGNSGQLDLIQMNWQIKNSFSSMYQIYNDNNVMDVIYLSGLVNIISDSKEFSFGGSDIDYIMESLDN